MSVFALGAILAAPVGLWLGLRLAKRTDNLQGLLIVIVGMAILLSLPLPGGTIGWVILATFWKPDYNIPLVVFLVLAAIVFRAGTSGDET